MMAEQRKEALVVTKKTQQPCAEIIELQEVSAARALQSLSQALQEGMAVQNVDGKKKPLMSLNSGEHVAT